MEFIKKSGNVSDVRIPEGNVIKITEKKSGKVLWEKGLCWEPVGNPNIFGKTFLNVGTGFDIGSNLIFFTSSCNKNGISETSAYFTYTPSNNKFSELTQLKLGDISCIAMHPDTKKWMAFVSGLIDEEGNYINMENSEGATKRLSEDSWLFRPNCCWVSHLNRFCIINASRPHFSLLVDKNGYCTDYASCPDTLPYLGCYQMVNNEQSMYYSSKLKKIFYTYHNSQNKTSGIMTSTDGLTWSLNNNYPFPIADSDIHEFRGGVLFIDTLNSLIFFHSSSDKIYQSTNGITWTEKVKSPANFSGCAWSPEHKIFCGIAYKNQTYITKDFVNWIKVKLKHPTGEETKIVTSQSVFWSHAANAFICTTATSSKMLFFKLEIDKLL